MRKQLDRWINSKNLKNTVSASDTPFLQKEISNLKTQEDRYNKAYGSGVFTINQLKEYVDPIKEKMSALEFQISDAKQEILRTETNLPNQNEIDKFTEEVKNEINNLSFVVKKGIMMNVLDKIVANKEQLQIYGYIPVASNYHVKYKTINRHRRSPKCWQIHII
ncbi:hypothetical protein EXS61_00580 [Candidatus Parcubacteria bacterium]|nr:hypothetical protein [Candidatus Parcubacteria bacterium]